MLKTSTWQDILVSSCRYSDNSIVLKCLDQWVISTASEFEVMALRFSTKSRHKQSLLNHSNHFTLFSVMPVATRHNTQTINKCSCLQPRHSIQNLYVSASSLIPRFCGLWGFFTFQMIKNPVWLKELHWLLRCSVYLWLNASQSGPHHNGLSVFRIEKILFFYDFTFYFLPYSLLSFYVFSSVMDSTVLLMCFSSWDC